MGQFIVSKELDGITVLGFSFNEIGLDQREVLKKELSDMIAAGKTRFVLNLSKVGFLSSLVIATIVFFAKEARKSDGEVKLCELTNEALSIFQLTQLDKVFELYETEDDALQSYKVS